MAELVRVWVRTSALDKIVHGKSTTSAKRAIPGADSDDSANLNWGWARCTVVADEGSKSSTAGLPPEGKPVKVFVQDEESGHNRSTLELPPNIVKDGDLVMANIYSGDDEEDDGDGYGSDEEGGEPGSCYPDDLITLTHLHEPAVVYCLRRRYFFDKIYTATGPILLALNPFKNCRSMYSESVMKQYFARGERTMLMSSARGDDDEDDDEEKKSEENAAELGDDEVLPPHVYGIADHSFRSMMLRLEESSGSVGGGRGRGKSKDASKGCDQSILVSGESGAGKTVTTKFIMQYLATLSTRSAGGGSKAKKSGKSDGDKKGIEQQVLQSNPILESFGNARTIRNDNSSRFGKFIEIQFTKSGSLVGASIDTYLLEKVRLITQAEGERNYHIFYELLQGMDDDDIDRYFLDEYSIEDFRMTSNSGTYDRRDGVDDCDTFQDLVNAMATMGFEEAEQVDIMTVTCAILHFSNLAFNSLSADESEIDKDNAHLDPVLSLLGVTYENLNRALCYFSITAGKEKHQRSLSKEKAEKGTDALIKATYGALFTHIVARVNSSITVKDTTSKRGSRGPSKAASIGVLDIFGFESFKHNSFEQLCINYCNEALQQQFNLFVLKNEQDEYEREGIKWSFISFPDNQDVLDLIFKKGAGILNILDDQCRAPGTTDKTFANDIYQKLTNHERFSANFRQVGALKFGVHHYAGPVEYETAGFVEKNRDELPKEATDLLLSSKSDFIKKLAGIISGDGGAEKAAPPSKSRRAGGAGTRVTVGGQFAKQLGELRAKIDLTSPHYVRCLKPNDQLVPDLFDPVIVSDQLRCAGVVEAVRVSRVGYPQRYSHSMFVNRYRILGLKALKMAARGSKKAKPVEVLVNHIAVKITEEESAGSAPAEAAKKTGTATSKKKAASTPKPSVDLVAVGMQVGKTKVFLRRKAFDTIERMRNQFMREAAIRIQAVARRYVAMREYGNDQKSILKLQCMVRRIIASRAVQKVRENFNATIIQTAYRRKMSRWSYLAVLVVAQWMQKRNRGRVGRMRYETLNRERKSKVLQKYWRRYSRVSWYNSAKKSSLLLQCALRCYWACMVLKDLRSNARNLQATTTERDELRKEAQELRKMLELARKQSKIEAEKAAAAATEAAMSTSEDAEKAEKLEEEMKELQEKLSSVEQDVQEKTSEIDEAKTKSSQIEQELNTTKEEKSELASRLDKIIEETDSKEKSIEELKNDLERTQDELKTAQASAAESAALSAEAEGLKEKVEELQQELETAANNEQNDEALEELQNLNTENEELRKTLEETNKRAEEAEAAIDEKAAAAAEVSVVDSAELTAALSEMEELKAKLQMAEKRAAEEAERAEKAESLSRHIDLSATLPPAASPGSTSPAPESPAPSSPPEPETTATNEEMALEVLTLQDEVQRLNRELADAKRNSVAVSDAGGSVSREIPVSNGVDSSPPVDDANDIIRRYEELRKLAEAGIQKDKEINDLKREVEVLRDELEAVDTLQSQGSSANILNGVADEPNEPKEPKDYSRSIPEEGELKDQDEANALRDVNEMLRKEIEIMQKVAKESEDKLKKETERSAMELEAFSETLRGVDELRSAAETMSRELGKNKRRDWSEDASVEARNTFREASRVIDGSGFKEDFWSKIASVVFKGGNTPKKREDIISKAMSRKNIGELPPKVISPKAQTKGGKRRRRRRNSGDSSIVSSFF